MKFSKNKNFSEKVGGFTLIEMLIVVAIIGILASAVIVGLGPAQQKGRDARRMSDLNSAQNALELYYTKNGSYPSATGFVQFSNIASAFSDVGISNFPTRDSSNRDYCYQNNNNTGYTIGTQLEIPPSSSDTSHACPSGFSCANTTPNYCISF